MNFYSLSFFLSAHHRESMVSRPKYEIVPFFNDEKCIFCQESRKSEILKGLWPPFFSSAFVYLQMLLVYCQVDN